MLVGRAEVDVSPAIARARSAHRGLTRSKKGSMGATASPGR